MKRLSPYPEADRPTLGRPKNEAKREAILRAATDLFLKDGYELTSMEKVADKAKVSKLTIYNHFADKSELFRSVIQRRCTKFSSPESYAALRVRPVREALTEIGMTVVPYIFSEDTIRMHRIMQAEATRQPESIKVFYETGPKRVRAAFCDLLKEYVQKDELNIHDIPKAAEQFFSLLKGEMLLKLLLRIETYPKPAEIKKHVAATVDMFLAAYQPHPTHTR